MASFSGDTGSDAGEPRFPWKTVLATLTVLTLLFAWHRFKDRATGLYPGIFADAFRLQLRRTPKAHLAKDGGEKKPMPASRIVRPGARPAISPYLVDDSGALDTFFASLHDLEAGKPRVVTILHYGDSPTTADLITGDARALLQARFGDAGHGFNLIAKPWAWYGHRDVGISDHGWKAVTGVGSMRQGMYGLGGARFEGGKDAHSTFKLADASQTDVEVQFFTEPDAGSVTVTADGATVGTIETAGDANLPSAKLLHLPANAKEVVLTADGPVTLLGVDFRKGDHGVVYDSLGLNGASTTVLSRAFDPTLWATELQHTAPALVVVNYGTNESSFGSFVDKQYEGELRLAVARIRKALPTVPILIMSPMDRGERAGLNEIHTMETIPRIVAIQQRVAAELHCGFFDTFDAMGGDGTMSDWYGGKPRLVSADLIHPTPQGALIVAQELVDNLNLGYARWQKLNGITPATAAPESKACRPAAPVPAALVPVAAANAAAAQTPPPGTIGAPTEPVPPTAFEAKSAAPAGSHMLPPCPAKPPVIKPAKPATHPSVAKPAGSQRPASGDTGKNDRSTTGKPSPGNAPQL